MFYKEDWFTLHSYKLCPQIQKKIGETYRHRRWVPSFLHRPINALKERFVKHKVIIELDTNRYTRILMAGEPKKVLGFKVEENLNLINGFSTKINIKALKRMLGDDRVAGVWHDREVKALLDIAAPAINAPQVWDRKHQGQGVGIAIVDTGIFPHPDLIYPKKRIIAFKDFVKGRKRPYDDNGHGTHCAGDAAGNGYKSKGKYKGTAPMANLIGVKVLDQRGSGSISKVMAGIQWCIKYKERYNIRVLSMSLGSSASQSSKDDPMCKAVRKAWEAGLIVCAAAGNEGPAPRTINTPGIEPKVITVGAVDDRNTKKTKDERIAAFSSRGPTLEGLTKPDVVAPGANIISLRSPRSYLDRVSQKHRVDRYYTSMSGTSMATPICAGAVALIIENSPHLSPAAVKKLLMDTCVTINENHNAQGSGLIDVQSAIKRSLSKATDS